MTSYEIQLAGHGVSSSRGHPKRTANSFEEMPRAKRFGGVSRVENTEPTRSCKSTYFCLLGFGVVEMMRKLELL